jgi:hypothetical protein
MIIAVAMTSAMTMTEGMTIDMIVVTTIATTVVIAIVTTDTPWIIEKRRVGGQLPDLLPF